MALSLTDIETKIQALLDNPEVDYTIGDKSVSASQKLDQLLKVRDALLQQQNSQSDIAIIAFDYDINQFGEDKSEVEL